MAAPVASTTAAISPRPRTLRTAVSLQSAVADTAPRRPSRGRGLVLDFLASASHSSSMPRVAEPERPAVEVPRIVVQDGVIEEARRRRRHRRTAIFAAALTALLAGLLAPLFYAGGGTVHPPSPHGSGVLATVTHWNCQMWVSCLKNQAAFPDRESQFLIATGGSARQIASFALARHQYTTPVFGSTATWVMTWPHSGPCSLRLVPGSRPAVRVPCGSAGPDTASGLWIFNGGVAMRVDPLTGRLRQRIKTQNELTPLPGDLALESADTATGPSGLALVNLATGARRPLRWPSSFRFGYQAFPAPHGPLVAIDFGEPWYPQAHESVNQAADLWVLNTSTGALTHVPGFPALELLKQSSVGWTADGRLVIAARGGRTVVGLWKPGQQTLPVRSVPSLDGYSQFVALTP